jgi:acyl-CoA reductase-like NAD-dependent aldehyde dehydrogenase
VTNIEKTVDQLGHLIDGRIVRNEETTTVVNPSTGEIVAHCPAATSAMLDEAVGAARRALPAWSATPIADRQAIIQRMGDVLKERFNELNEVASLEKGVERAAAEGYAATFVADHLAKTDLHEDVLEDNEERIVRVIRKPVGVVAAISPWNAPLLISASKVFTALLVGNTVVVKPSPFTPLGTLLMGELWRDLVPPGVVNVLAGGDEFGAAMVEHPGIDLVSFTGSVAAGKKIAEASGRHMKRFICELGGNDAAIVLPDVDVPTVAEQIFGSAFLLSGQACALVKRLYVHRSIYDEMVTVLADIAREKKAAPESDGGTLGPLITKPQFERVQELIDDAIEGGAKVEAGGPGEAGEIPGFYYAPTILTNVGAGVRVVDEEQFGPVLPVIPFDDVEDAIAQANASRYGLGGSIWTGDLEQGERLAARLECGTAWVNHHTETNPHVPFGGVKDSGIGRSGGFPGIDDNADLQTQIIYKKIAKVVPSADVA